MMANAEIQRIMKKYDKSKKNLQDHIQNVKRKGYLKTYGHGGASSRDEIVANISEEDAGDSQYDYENETVEENYEDVHTTGYGDDYDDLFDPEEVHVDSGAQDAENVDEYSIDTPASTQLSRGERILMNYDEEDVEDAVLSDAIRTEQDFESVIQKESDAQASRSEGIRIQIEQRNAILQNIRNQEKERAEDRRLRVQAFQALAQLGTTSLQLMQTAVSSGQEENMRNIVENLSNAQRDIQSLRDTISDVMKKLNN